MKTVETTLETTDSFLVFKISNRLVAIAVKELASSTSACPCVAFKGLPFGIKGIAQWGGQSYPILDLEALCFGQNQKLVNNNFQSAMIFSLQISNTESEFKHFAIQLPEEVNVVKGIKKSNTTVYTAEGDEAYLLTFSDLVIQQNQDPSKIISTAANF